MTLMKRAVLICLSTFLLTFILVTRYLTVNAEDYYPRAVQHSLKIVRENLAFDTLYNPICQSKFDVLHYDIRVTLLPEEKMVRSTVRILGVFADSSDSLVFNLYDNMQIDSITINGNKAGYQRTPTQVVMAAHQYSVGDTLTVKAYYYGKPKRLGFSSFVFGQINNIPLIHTLNEPQFASTWLFCEDSPQDKATMEIAVTADSSLTVVSNGKLMGINSMGAMKETRWATGYPIATYLICIYASWYSMFEDSFTSMDGTKMPLQYFVIPKHLENAKKDLKEHPKMLAVFESLFGQYPFVKEKYGIAEFLWQGGAMEHQTITGVGTGLMSGHNYFEDIYVHELAHHWWGNAVTLKSWKDIWLNEGFASYSEVLYYEKTKGPDAVHRKLAEFSQFYETGTLYAPTTDLFSPMVYHKGAYVLHMLRNEIGDSAFFQLLKAYFKNHCYGYADTEDFKLLAEKISGKDLTRFFNQWVYKGTDVPQVNFTWKNAEVENGHTITLNFEQVQESKLPYEFSLDLTIETAEGNLERIVRLKELHDTFTFAVNSKVISVIPDPARKVLFEYKDMNTYD